MLIDVNTYEFNVIEMTYNRVYDTYCNLTDYITGANFRDSFFSYELHHLCQCFQRKCQVF